LHYIYAEKSKTQPLLQNPAGIYSLVGKTLLKYCLTGALQQKIVKQVVIIFDKALTQKDRGAFEGTVKPELKKLGLPFHIYFHRTMSDMNGQIADYAAWSLYVWLERQEPRPLNELKDLKPSYFDIFRKGKIHYYKK